MHNGFLWQLLLHCFGIVAFHSAVTATRVMTLSCVRKKSLLNKRKRVIEENKKYISRRANYWHK
jgi:hypothetical protein